MKKENYKETRLITDVTKSKDWYSISMDGICCGLKTKYNVTPKVGDKLTVHTKGGSFGTIRGMDLNGKRIWWKTDKQLEESRQKWLKENEESKQKEFTENKSKMDKQYSELPKCFQQRIDKFRKNNPKFRVDYEKYELFCCEQAILIANAYKTPEEIKKFNELSWEDQIKKVPELSHDHSGNTFGMACRLAYWYLLDKKNVTKLYGSLSVLVGSEEYGDVSKEV